MILLLYCDTSSLNQKNVDINQILDSFSTKHIQANSNVWFFKIPKGFFSWDSRLSEYEHIFNKYFQDLTIPKSCCFIVDVSNQRFDGEFSDDVIEFLSKDL